MWYTLLCTKFFDTRNFQKYKRVPPCFFSGEKKSFRYQFMTVRFMVHQNTCPQQMSSARNSQKHQKLPKVPEGLSYYFLILSYCGPNRSRHLFDDTLLWFNEAPNLLSACFRFHLYFVQKENSEFLITVFSFSRISESHANFVLQNI